MSVSTVLKAVKLGVSVGGKWVVKNLPTIITAVSSVGVVAGTVMAVKKAPEAEKELNEVKQEWKDLPDKEKRSKADYIFKLVRVGTRYYWMVCLVIGGSLIGFWIANHLNLKRIAAAVAAAKISQDNLKDLENKIREKEGDKKLKEMKEEIGQDKAKEAFKDPAGRPPCSSPEVLMWEPIGGHKFVGDYEKVRVAVSKVKEELESQLDDGENYAFVSLNEFLSEFNAPQCEYGELLGFSVQLPNHKIDMSRKSINELIDNAISVGVASILLDDGFTPATSLVYHVPPKYCYEQARKY